MRRWTAWLMVLVLSLTVSGGAYAAESYRIAGYDHADTQHVWTENLFFERMEARTGLKLDLVQYTTAESWQAAKDAMLSGNAELPDALLKASLTTQETMKWYEAGKLIDLRPYLEQYMPNLWALLEANPAWLSAISLPDGAIVALPAIDQLQFNNAMWINKSWLQSLGMEAPTNVEELTEVLRAFRERDMNANGDAGDEVPLSFSSMWDLRYLAHGFGINANDYYVTLGDDGVVTQYITTDANRQFLTWLHTLWQEGLLDETGFTGLRNLNLQTNDKDAPAVYGMLMAASPAELINTKLLDQYALLMPMTCDGKQVYRDLTGDLIRGTFAVTSACKEPEKLLTWLDYLYTEEGFVLAEAGMEGEEFEYNDDGTWLWTSTAEELTSNVLPHATIRSGNSMPGLASVEFQSRIDDQQTARIIGELAALKAIDTEPYPLVWLTDDQQKRVNELQLDIGRYAETQMTWFVTGDKELNDANWQEFCDQVMALGMEEMLSIWQSAADARK